MRPKIDWVKAKQEYINNKNRTLKDIERAYGVSYTRIQVISKRENWQDEKAKLWKRAEKDAIEEIEGSVKDLIIRHARVARFLQAVGLKEMRERINKGSLSKESMGFLLSLIQAGLGHEQNLYPKQLQITGEVGVTAETIPEDLKEAIYEIYRKRTTGRKRPSIHRGASKKSSSV